MRLVLDTNIVASALSWGGVPRLLLQAGRDKRVSLFTSIPLLAELTDILVRPKFEKKLTASGLTIEQIVDRYAELAALVQPAAIEPTVLRDPDDDEVLACTMAARADLIVSGDRLHLLPLGKFENAVVAVPMRTRRGTRTYTKPYSSAEGSTANSSVTNFVYICAIAAFAGC